MQIQKMRKSALNLKVKKINDHILNRIKKERISLTKKTEVETKVLFSNLKTVPERKIHLNTYMLYKNNCNNTKC